MTVSDRSAEAARRKRLGQFFTGDRLSSLLAELAAAGACSTIVDPMAGSGDMLVASLRAGARPTVLAAVEIDPRAARRALERLTDTPTAHVSVGNAFDHRAWEGLPAEWDLVITNPPYVRYQSGSRGTLGALAIPDARDVRRGLLSLLAVGPPSGGDDVGAFQAAAREYSGLADLAVPSWILAASRVRVGGRLAIVVPNTWLTRDYAAPVLNLLRQFFEIEYVVDDHDASWFEDALVRTSLVVARRIDATKAETQSTGYLRVQIAREAADERSLVGKAFPRAKSPEAALARWAAQLRRTASDSSERVGIQAAWSDGTDLRRERTPTRPARMTSSAGEDEPRSAVHVPEVLRTLAAESAWLDSTVGDLGWNVGQGLRSGANDFFYVRLNDDGSCRSSLLPRRDLELPPDVLLPAIRQQRDLPGTGSRVMDTRWRLLWLADWALDEDARRHVESGRNWRVMSGDLELLVRTAAMTRHAHSGVLLPELSAVRTNARESGGKARFWYQLPSLAPRHSPDLLIARVNGATPRAWLNPDCRKVVDANFSSLWPVNPTAAHPLAVLAILNSVWARAAFEAMGTVMGGGALKLEASHLRRVPLPRLDDESIARLQAFGAELVSAEHLTDAKDAIDHLLLSKVQSGNPETLRGRLAGLLESLRAARTPPSRTR